MALSSSVVTFVLVFCEGRCSVSYGRRAVLSSVAFCMVEAGRVKYFFAAVVTGVEIFCGASRTVAAFYFIACVLRLPFCSVIA